MITIGIEGGPADGEHITVTTGADGQPPAVQDIRGGRYVLDWPGIQPWDDGWHYCHRG